MPQRLTHTPSHAAHALEVNGRSLLASHAQIVSILHSRLGQSHGDLLATPHPAADGVDWTTALAGEVQPVAALPPEEQARLGKRTQQMLNDIRNLGRQLGGEGAAAQMVGQMLEYTARIPPGDWLYSVGGKPVLAMWGHAAEPPAAPAVPAAVAAAAAAPVPPVAPEPVFAPAVAADAAVDAAAPRPARRWQWALLALPLLAALAFLLLRGCTPDAPREPGVDARLAEAQARNKTLEEEIARKKIPAEQFTCVRPPPEPEPAASAPAAAASEPEPPASKAEAPKADPYDALQNRLAAAGRNCTELQALSRERLLRDKGTRAQGLQREVMQALQQNCGERLITEARNMCPGQRPAELAPELVLVFDASGSMRWSLGASEQDIQKLAQLDAMQGMMRQFGLGQGIPGVDMGRVTREPTRMSAARQAALTTVRRAPSDASIGLVLIEQCPAARSAGFFPPARRGQLVNTIEGIQPRLGTPLADGIAQGGRMVDGVKREALMVVISDGTESCGRDPCAEAAALARAKPHLKINVVDITGTGAGNCVAQAGRGRVFTARNAEEVAAMTRQASQDAMGPANCAKP